MKFIFSSSGYYEGLELLVVATKYYQFEGFDEPLHREQGSRLRSLATLVQNNDRCTESFSIQGISIVAGRNDYLCFVQAPFFPQKCQFFETMRVSFLQDSATLP
jgi:hypothetical protein